MVKVVIKRSGAKPKGKVKIKWSPNFAYAIGLLATDGCVYGKNRHVNLTTKDKEQAENFQKALGIKLKMAKKKSGFTGKKVYYHLQFGDVLFCKFLNRVGIYPAKSKTLGALEIPDEYFFDFLRGSHDGDGSFYSYWDPRWKSSFMFYLTFGSASVGHVNWLRGKISNFLKIKGHISKSVHPRSIFQLRFAKKDSLKILRRMYYRKKLVCLSRKRLKIEKALGIVGLHL